MGWWSRIKRAFGIGRAEAWGEPPPNEREPVWELVIRDMRARDRFGRAKYGTPLQAFNGRNVLKDIYEEDLDRIAYLRQLLEEQRMGEEVNEVGPPTLRVGARGLADLINENARLMARVDELLASNSRLVEERRDVDINGQVRQFFVIAEQAMGTHPHVPKQAVTRFRARLVAEEFIELMEAIFAESAYLPTAGEEVKLAFIRDLLMSYVDEARIELDLPKMADACADVDYVVAGMRVAFGIDGRPIMRAVHAANMAKQGGPIRPSDGKRMKPEGWTPPDIVGELVKQGWSPCSVCEQRDAEFGGLCAECDADAHGERDELDRVRNLPVKEVRMGNIHDHIAEDIDREVMG
jgi:predicted HAD superfamily Cof-like phosphohydrolase